METFWTIENAIMYTDRAFIDRFGRDVAIHPSNKEGWSETSVEVALSDQFFGWIFAIGSGVKIVGPDEVVEAFRKKLCEMAEEYK